MVEDLQRNYYILHVLLWISVENCLIIFLLHYLKMGILFEPLYLLTLLYVEKIDLLHMPWLYLLLMYLKCYRHLMISYHLLLQAFQLFFQMTYRSMLNQMLAHHVLNNLASVSTMLLKVLSQGNQHLKLIMLIIRFLRFEIQQMLPIHFVHDADTEFQFLILEHQ